MKYALSIIGVLALLGLGLFAGVRLSSMKFLEKQTSEQSTVLLEEIKDVMKLVTVEGYFSEVYDYKDYYWADWKPFSKKALIRIKAKVSVGYDLEKMTFRADGVTKTIHIEGLPQPEIISVDHDLDYYDLQQGSFNTFSVDDYNKLNKRAKEFIISKVGESSLFEQAGKQVADIQNVVSMMAESQGWQVVYDDEVVSPLN